MSRGHMTPDVVALIGEFPHCVVHGLQEGRCIR